MKFNQAKKYSAASHLMKSLSVVTKQSYFALIKSFNNFFLQNHYFPFVSCMKVVCLLLLFISMSFPDFKMLP